VSIVATIINLTAPAMLHAIALRAGAFWLAGVIVTLLIVASWTREPRPRIWR